MEEQKTHQSKERTLPCLTLPTLPTWLENIWQAAKGHALKKHCFMDVTNCDSCWFTEKHLTWCLENHARKLKTSAAMYLQSHLYLYLPLPISGWRQHNSKSKFGIFWVSCVLCIWGNQSCCLTTLLITSPMFPMDAVAMLAHAVVAVASLRLHAATSSNN